SLLHCHGIITGGGFETPAEALYLKKKLMCIPIRGQYEQECNAAALQQAGITVLDDADTDHFAADIETWLNTADTEIDQQANNIGQTLDYILQLNP
nr:glycosyl transferase [Chitinophagaceae bacterium]